MGTVKVTIGVGDPQGRHFEDVEVVVDTGSTCTAVPREMLQNLEVTVERSLHSETADGRLVPVDVGRDHHQAGGTGVPHARDIRRTRRAHHPGSGQSGGGCPGRRPSGRTADTGKPATPLIRTETAGSPTPWR